MWIVPVRDTTAITVRLARADENVPEKRRPSCLSIVSANATLLSCGSAGWVGPWWGFPPPKTIVSLSPFQVPRRSGIAVSATAGAAVSVASAASVTIQTSFDMAGFLQARFDRRFVGWATVLCARAQDKARGRRWHVK